MTESARAQLPVGAEFQVNSYTTNNQRAPSAAASAAGFVVVWTSLAQDGSGDGVFGQRYTSSGAPLGAEFRVNSYTTNGQRYPSVATDTAGDFVVVWQSTGQDGSVFGIFGQRFTSSGARLGSDFQVSTYTVGNQVRSRVASGATGNFVVVWDSAAQDGSVYGVFGQRYASSGARLGTEFQVNTYTTELQTSPSVACDAAGRFVVVWQSFGNQDGDFLGVFGQRYASSGARLGLEFQVNSYTPNSQSFPAVASDSAGNFVVVWPSYTQDGSADGVFGQRYDSVGARLGTEFRVNSQTMNNQKSSSVASDPAGNFVVAWKSYLQDGVMYGVFGQRYDSSGAEVGTEFQVNTFAYGNQDGPSVASDPAGTFVVAWRSDGQDGSGDGVFGQLFCVQPLTAVSVSAVGPTTICTTGTGATATVMDTGGISISHQWYFRALPAGSYVSISGQTGTSYLIKGSDLPGPGSYRIVCLSIPFCGPGIFSPETVTITVVTDATSPLVTAPGALATAQTICQ